MYEDYACYFNLKANDGVIYHVFDASKIKLGKMIPRVATVLMGKNRPDYQRNYSSSPEKVVIVNASNIKVSRNKLKVIKYYSYTGYPSGLKIKELGTWMKKDPIKCMNTIVKKQLPKNNIMEDYLSKLIVYGGPYHDLHRIGIPQFMPMVMVDPNDSPYLKISAETDVLVGSSTGTNPEEYKDVPIQLDPLMKAGASEIEYTTKPDISMNRRLQKLHKKFEKRKGKDSKGL